MIAGLRLESSNHSDSWAVNEKLPREIVRSSVSSFEPAGFEVETKNVYDHFDGKHMYMLLTEFDCLPLPVAIRHIQLRAGS